MNNKINVLAHVKKYSCVSLYRIMTIAWKLSGFSSAYSLILREKKREIEQGSDTEFHGGYDFSKLWPVAEGCPPENQQLSQLKILVILFQSFYCTHCPLVILLHAIQNCFKKHMLFYFFLLWLKKKK